MVEVPNMKIGERLDKLIKGDKSRSDESPMQDLDFDIDSLTEIAPTGDDKTEQPTILLSDATKPKRRRKRKPTTKKSKTQLSEVTQAKLETIATTIKTNLKDDSANWLNSGQGLKQAKKLLSPVRMWSSWLRDMVDLDRRLADDRIRGFERFGKFLSDDKTEQLQRLKPDALRRLSLANVDDSVITKVRRMLATKAVTLGEVKKLLRSSEPTMKKASSVKAWIDVGDDVKVQIIASNQTKLDEIKASLSNWLTIQARKAA